MTTEQEQQQAGIGYILVIIAVAVASFFAWRAFNPKVHTIARPTIACESEANFRQIKSLVDSGNTTAAAGFTVNPNNGCRAFPLGEIVKNVKASGGIVRFDTPAHTYWTFRDAVK